MWDTRAAGLMVLRCPSLPKSSPYPESTITLQPSKTMFHPDDIELILQMTGLPVEDLPKGFEQEYETRLRMLHRSGSSSAMTSTHLIPLLREYLVGPPDTLVSKTNDWAKVPGGTEIEVVDAASGRSRTAKLIGVVSLGSVAIRFDGESEIHEVANHSVSLSDNYVPDLKMPDASDDDDEPVAPPPKAPAKGKARAKKADPPPEPPSIDWNEIENGELVLVGDAKVDGIFASCNDDGTLCVVVDGVKGSYPVDQVALSPF